MKGRLTKQETQVMHELMKSADLCVPVDAADPRVQFEVRGWFVLPRGSLTKPHDILDPA